MDIADICITSYSHYFCPCHYFPPIKTPTYNNTHDCKNTHFAVAPPIFLLIAGMLGATAAATVAFANTRNVGVYWAIAVSVCIDIVYKQVVNMAKDVWVMDCQLNEFEDSLNEIKNELVFLKYNVIAFVHNAGLLNIE